MKYVGIIIFSVMVACLLILFGEPNPLIKYIINMKRKKKIKKKNKKLNELRERIEFYGFLTDICRDMANRHTMNTTNYIKRSEFFCDLEHKAVEEYNKLNGEK